MTQVRRLFIANRGEIARRIAATARRMGIQTIALTDRATPPAYLLDVIDHFVHVEEEKPALYLDAAAMVRHAKDSGADALHPGFGFLSENAGFAAAVQKAGLVWVGPHPEAIEAMASKAGARDRAVAAGVPVILGISGFPVPTDEKGDFKELEAFAQKAGFPLLIKAALGGGGKGMRTVNAMGELREAALRCRSEAINSFGDDALICEQYLGAPRHVEVQVMADKHGNVFAIGDRDCSVQRRHQKIIEEAPAPELTETTRKALHAAAVCLGKAVGYDNAGTVEFLVDWSESARRSGEQPFYFLEMNTRLQVEHPVTEEVYGIDLVEQQLRVASGERLPAHFAALAPRGHSVEVRIYAEDPFQGFFPAPGPVAAFKPASGPGVRWEIGLDEVDEVTGRFDPMVAKLIVTADSRPSALARLVDALDQTFLAGPATNLTLLRELSTVSDFARGAVTTHYLGAALPKLLQGIAKRAAEHEAQASELLDALERGDFGETQADGLARDPAKLTAAIFAGGSAAAATAPSARPRIALMSSQRSAAVPHATAQSGRGFAGRPFWFARWRTATEQQSWIAIGGLHYSRRAARKDRAAGAGADAAASTDVLAPVPGKVIAVKASAGAEVAQNDAIFVLESMKMEFEVKAVRGGKLAAVNVKVGDQVTAGFKLASWA